MSKPFIIAVGGAARCGKNSLATGLIDALKDKGIAAKEYSFAKELRKELDPLTLLNLGISAHTQDPVEKEIIRPLLICWGTQIWRKIDADHWIKALDKNLEGQREIAVVSDNRFPNESEWAKKNGSLIHLTRFDLLNKEILPANDDERTNDPIVKSMADYCHEWTTFGENNKKDYKLHANVIITRLFSDRLTTWKTLYPITN